MAQLLGTVLASPVVPGNSDLDYYPTHYSHMGTGGFSEFSTIAERNAIPIDILNRLGLDGLSSGRRRLGQLVYVGANDTIYQLYINFSLWTGMTTSQKVAALANNANWIEFGGNGGGDAIKRKYSVPAHGFVVGDVVGHNGTTVVKKIASVGDTVETLGIVSRILDSDNVVITYAGFMDLTGVTGLTSNTTYFVSTLVAGKLSTVEPFNTGEENRPILITQTSVEGVVVPYRSQIITDSPSGGTGGGTGFRIQRQAQKSSHGFGLGTVVFYSGGTYLKAIANQTINDFAVGLVSSIQDANTFTITYAGYIDGISSVTDDVGAGLTAGRGYYLSPSVAGKLTKNTPTVIGNMIKPMIQVLTTNDAIVLNQRGIPIVDTYKTAREVFVVDDIAERTARFFASGGTGTSGQTESFEGLRVFVLDATGAPELPSGFTGASEFIDTTGFLNWVPNPTNLNVVLDWSDIMNKPPFITGATHIGTGLGKIFVSVSGGTKMRFRSIKKGPGISVTNDAADITISFTGASTTTIGAAEDGSYTDGIFTDFTPTTPIGTAIDRFNELFLLTLPAPPSGVTQTSAFGTFVTPAKLSFGSSKSIAGFTNVGTNAGNAAVDINATYTASGTRLGVTSLGISGVINDSVVGNVSGIPYLDNSFADGDKGKLILYKNGVVLSQLILSGTTAATSNAHLSVSQTRFVKSPSGLNVTPFKYRTGTYAIPLTATTNGFNYFRIVHSGSTFSRVTNFFEWVRDPDASNITISSTTGLTNLSLSGTKAVSGVLFHTSGTIDYVATINNAYKNVFSASATAIDFPNKENLGAITNMIVSGAGIIGRTGSTLQTLPNLNTAATDPQNTAIAIIATNPINATRLVGNVGATGRVRSGLSVTHPFTSQSFSGGLSTATGFLFYNVTQASDMENENFDGEVNRLEARNYTGLVYAAVDGGTYAWDSTENLISGDGLHSTGLLVFNGELMYPNAAYLTTQYGITTGNFAAVTNAQGSNPNYTSATGIRSHYRKFKSNNGATQANLTFTIDHTGTSGNFLTNGGTGGTASGNNIKFEFAILRSGGAIHGWANPFASTGNPEGIANTSISQVGTVMTVSCTLSTVPRVANGDLVIVRIFAAAAWANRIANVAITNI